MKNDSPKTGLLKPIYIALAFYLLAGGIETLLIYTKNSDIFSPDVISSLKKLIILFSTLSTVILLRWLIVDTPFSFLRRFTIAPLLKTILTLLIYFAAGMTLLNKLFGINLKPLLTTSAVLTGVLALSLQETIKNLFTGIWINADRIVAKGDWVRIGDKEGQVMEVNWRATKLLTREDDGINIPNRLLAEGVIENFTFPTPLHVVEVEIGASYNDPPNKVKEILIDVANGTPGVLGDPSSNVWITHYSDFSIHYRLRACVADFKDAPSVKSEIYARIWYAFRRNNIEIPYPVRVNYSRTEPTGASAFSTAEVLKSVELFTPLKREELERLASLSTIGRFGKGETIFRQDDEGDTFYVIKEGSVDVYIKDAMGGEKLVTTLTSGDFFGEMSLLAGEPRKATIQAKEDCSFIILSSQAFKGMISENPDLAESLGEQIIKRTAQLNGIREDDLHELERKKAEKVNLVNKIRRFFKDR